MQTRLIQLLRLTAGYSLASLAGPIFTIVLTPLYTRVLQPADYAVLDTLMTLGFLVTTLATLGLNAAMGMFFYDQGPEHQQKVIVSAAALGLISALCMALLLALSAMPLAQLLMADTYWAGLIRLTAFNLPFAILAAVFNSALRLQFAVKRANILSLMAILLTVTLNIGFVLGLRWGVTGIMLTTVIVTLLQVLIGGIMLLPALRTRPNAALMRLLAAAGPGLMLGGLAYWALAYADRLILPMFGVTLQDRGLYAIAAKLASLLAIVIVPFQMAWGPLSLSMRDDPHAHYLYPAVLRYVTAASLALAMVLSLFARDILFLFTSPTYLDAAPYVLPLSYVSVANGVAVAVGVGAYLAKRARLVGFATALGAGANFVLNLLLIPRFGVWGAAWATAMGYALTPLVLAITAQRVYPLPFEWQRPLMALLMQLALLSIGIVFAHDGIQGMALRLGLLGLYGVGIVSFGVITPQELRSALKALKEYSRKS